jgi:hypothetical protein
VVTGSCKLIKAHHGDREITEKNLIRIMFFSVFSVSSVPSVVFLNFFTASCSDSNFRVAAST